MNGSISSNNVSQLFTQVVGSHMDRDGTSTRIQISIKLKNEAREETTPYAGVKSQRTPLRVELRIDIIFLSTSVVDSRPN